VKIFEGLLIFRIREEPAFKKKREEKEILNYRIELLFGRVHKKILPTGDLRSRKKGQRGVQRRGKDKLPYLRAYP